jgi:Ulp1 family protease
LNCVELGNTLVVQYDAWFRIFNNGASSRLEKVDIHNYNYIVGPHIVNRNHWVSVIVDMNSANFQVIDPRGVSCELSKTFYDSWVSYYGKRNDASIKKWFHNSENIKHPLQKDKHNCGIFVCLFIEHFILKHNKIQFNSDKDDLTKYRKQIAQTLEKNSRQ